MDLNYTSEEESFRQQVRSWLATNLPTSGLRGADDRANADKTMLDRMKEWHRRLHEAGYLALSWPKEYGGQAMDPMRQAIVNEEMVRARAPGPIGGGIPLLGPTLITWGSEEQKRRYLPKILNAEEIWCQGYSEPGSGSDLASLRTRAEITGDEFVVNGQKIWTSGAHYSDWMFCLVRTDPQAPKHRGISYILINMKDPGITVRPLVQMTGDRGFNEVFFDNVHVPRENLVGKLNEGWMVANTTLFHERNALGSTVTTQRLFNRLKELAASVMRRGQPLTKDPVFRQRLADLEIRVEAMKYHMLRQLTDAIQGRNPGLAAMVNKLVGTELNHDLATAAMEVMGDYAMLARGEESALDHGFWPYEWMFSLGLVIGGGTSHIQKNIIAERGLKMPKGR